MSIEQSVLQSKRDLKVKILLDAYLRLENIGSRSIPPIGYKKDTFDYVYFKYSESALSAVQLLADKPTVELAVKFILTNQGYSELLKALRAELRKELEVETLPNSEYDEPSHYRFYKRDAYPSTPEQQYQLTLKLAELGSELSK